MSEIEKMYELAKVKAINVAEYGSTYIPDSIQINGHLYPQFTAEKQLELIKLIAREHYFIARNNNEVKYYDLFTNSMNDYHGFNEDFKEALANLVNNLWQDLTEEEKQQVKGILE